MRRLLFFVGLTVTVLGLPFAFASHITLGLWILCGVFPCLLGVSLGGAPEPDTRPGFPADKWRHWEGEE